MGAEVLLNASPEIALPNLSRADVHAHLLESFRDDVPALETAIALAKDAGYRQRLQRVLSELRPDRKTTGRVIPLAQLEAGILNK